MRNPTLLTMEGIEAVKGLMNVSMGKEKADLSIINANVLNVYTGEILEGHSISVKGDWIAYTGNEPDGTIGEDTRVIDAGGKVIIPGFIDGHTHLADCFYHPSEFLGFVMARGTTTIITETIEPFPIMGYEGIMDFLAALREQPIKIFATIPAMVSTSRGLKPPSQEEMKRLLSREDILGLGESYWQAVIREPDRFLPNFFETLMFGKRLEGHSAGAKEKKLMAYVVPGITSCHEPINAEEALERLRLGLYVMVREGSIRRDLKSISKIMVSGMDTRRIILVSDGIGPKDILKLGYMENIVQTAIDLGIDPVNAIRMVTLNVAEYFHLDGITGGIAPGKHADMLILPDIETMRAEYVLSRGKIIAREGDLLIPPKKYTFSDRSLHSVSFRRELTPSDFAINLKRKVSHIRVRIIEQATDLVTREFRASVPVTRGEIRANVEEDILKVAAIDRAISPGKMFVGLIRGFRLTGGALACSSAWDTSDIIVIGADDEDMAHAVNHIYSLQGGALVCLKGEILNEIPLPIFGLMSDLSMEDLVRKYNEMTETIKALGVPFTDPLRTLITLTGAAIPFLRICEEGLVDIKNGKTVDFIVS